MSQSLSATPLPYSSEAHQQAHQFLVEEAHLLDSYQLDEWLGLLCEDIRYLMPVQVTRVDGALPDFQADMDHFDEDLYSLRLRVARLRTGHAWTEDPRSRVRHFVTNVRTFAGPNEGELSVESSVLLFRSRGDNSEAQLVSAGRKDVLRQSVDGRYRLAERTLTVDESVLRTQNLAIFL